MVQHRPWVPVSYIRGGTSKALFFHEHNVPPAGALRDRFLRRIMGSPDRMQIDGMGGSHLVTSKVALIRPSVHGDADVDYTFVQVGIDNDVVGYSGNCGNISAGVGPFAIDEGLVKEKRTGVSLEPGSNAQEVRIYNTGTNKILISHVPIDPLTGLSLETGNASIDGCPGSGAPILMDYSNVSNFQIHPLDLDMLTLQVVGATRGKGALPTECPIDNATVDDASVEYTICDVGNITIFVDAHGLGLQGDELAADLDNDHQTLARIKELRGKAAVRAGMCQNWELVDEQSPMLPMVAVVSRSLDPGCQIQSRLFLDNKCHTAMAGTGAICTAACSRISGSVVNRLLSELDIQQSTLNIQHPSGRMAVVVMVTPNADPEEAAVPTYKSLSFVRTARRILDARLYIPDDVKDCVPKS